MSGKRPHIFISFLGLAYFRPLQWLLRYQFFWQFSGTSQKKFHLRKSHKIGQVGVIPNSKNKYWKINWGLFTIICFQTELRYMEFILKPEKSSFMHICECAKAMSLSNGNWQSQNVLFIKIMQFFGPSASIYCPGAERICPNATIFRWSTSIFALAPGQ